MAAGYRMGMAADEPHVPAENPNVASETEEDLPTGVTPDPADPVDDDEPPHLQHGSPHPNEPAPYDPPNPNVP